MQLIVFRVAYTKVTIKCDEFLFVWTLPQAEVFIECVIRTLTLLIFSTLPFLQHMRFVNISTDAVATIGDIFWNSNLKYEFEIRIWSTNLKYEFEVRSRFLCKAIDDPQELESFFVAFFFTI